MQDEGEGASWQEQGGFICNAAVCMQALNSREAVQVCRALQRGSVASCHCSEGFEETELCFWT